MRLQTRLDEDLQAVNALSLMDYHVLLRLHEAPAQRLRMGELAEQLVFSPSRLTYQVRSMEQRGLVVRERCPEDRRGIRAVLTAAGLQGLHDAAPRHRRLVRALWLDELTEAELECVADVFTRLDRTLNAPTTTTGAALSSE